MSFPSDLSDVAAFKVHPALGVARLANSDDYYEFFEYEKKRKAGHTVRYMSPQKNPLDPEEKTYQAVKRQAVQFRIFAYGESGQELGELSGDTMSRLGIKPTWNAEIANRKLNTWNKDAHVVTASGAATGDEKVRLDGRRPWPESSANCHAKVWLGELTGSGLFIPPKGGVYRKDEGTKIPRHGHHRKDNGFQDTTSDGAIGVHLSGAESVPLIPAAVLVAPQQHSPDVNPGDGLEVGNNKDFETETKKLLGIKASRLPGTGYKMDADMMRTINADYNPGMEICLDGEGNPSLPDPGKAFYPRDKNHIAKAEIRPSYENGRAKHGALTAGLCSVWQTDLSACLRYWTAEFPYDVNFDDEPDERPLTRAKYFGVSRISDPEWLNAYIDNMDIARKVGSDVNKLKGTERDADVGGNPKPRSVDPPQ